MSQERTGAPGEVHGRGWSLGSLKKDSAEISQSARGEQIWSSARIALAPVRGGEAADVTVDIVNGIIRWDDRARRDRRRYLVHLARVAARRAAHNLSTIWCRGLSDDRTVAWGHGSGTDTLRLFMIGLPLLLAGIWGRATTLCPA